MDGQSGSPECCDVCPVPSRKGYPLMANLYFCSDGSRVSEGAIKSRYTAAIREKYQGSTVWRCEGCGGAPNGSAHIIPKARLKVLHMTELIWNPIMFFPACNFCNMICENVASDEITKLQNYDYIREIIERYDPERASKLPEKI